MRKLIIAVALMLLSLMLSADSGDETEAALFLLENLQSQDEMMAYQFQINAMLLLESEARGGIGAYTDEGLVASWASDDATDDMFLAPTSDVLIAAFIVPSEVSEGIFAMLGDGEAMSAIRTARSAGIDELLMVSFAEPYRDACLKSDLVADRLIDEIEKRAGGFFLSAEELWGALEDQGIAQEEALNLIKSGERTIDETVESALRAIREKSKSDGIKRAVLATLSVFSILGLMALSVFAIRALREKRRIR